MQLLAGSEYQLRRRSQVLRMNSPALRNEIAIDAGPLIALARIDLLDLPSRLFRDAVTTRTVVDECMLILISSRPGRLHWPIKRRQTMPPVSTVYTFSNLDGEISVLQMPASKVAVLIAKRTCLCTKVTVACWSWRKGSKALLLLKQSSMICKQVLHWWEKIDRIETNPHKK